MLPLKFVLLAVLLAAPVVAGALEQRLKVEGSWDGRTIQVTRIKQRDPDVNVRQVRIEGVVAFISSAERTVEIGPVRAVWLPPQDALFDDVDAGDAMRVDAVRTGDQYFSVIRAEAVTVYSDNAVKFIGAMTGFVAENDGTTLYLAGIPVKAPRRFFSNGRLRSQRLGDRRPDDQFMTTLAGIPTTIGGEVGIRGRGIGNPDLDDGTGDDELRTGIEVQLEAFMEISDSVSAFAEVKVQDSARFDLPLQKNREQFALKRGEMWLYLDRPFGLPADVQVGRQSFEENREWWWDTDLDALRIYLTAPALSFEVAIAEELGQDTLLGEVEDAEDLDVRRLLASARWRLASELSVATFFVHHDDHSSSFAVAEVLGREQLDEDDADLNWLGARLSGELDWFDGVEAEYWVDYARVWGTETRYDFDEIGAGQLVVTSVRSQRRSGAGFDAGATIAWPDAGLGRMQRPAITLALAGGDGGRGDMAGFRQTGLHKNNGKFTGVDRFRYYGELTRPELENLRVFTASAGFRIGEDSSIELGLHRYRQDRLSADHGLDLEAGANGLSPELGQELDLVVGIEPWKHLELEAVAAYFMPGAALAGTDPAWFLAFKLDYNF